MEEGKKITKDELDNIISNSKGKIIIIDFAAEWCGPCRMIGPVLDKLAEENPNIQVIKVNVDENSDAAVEYGVRSIPAVFIYKEGVQTDKFVGVKSKEEIIKLL